MSKCALGHELSVGDTVVYPGSGYGSAMRIATVVKTYPCDTVDVLVTHEVRWGKITEHKAKRNSMLQYRPLRVTVHLTEDR